MDALVNSLPAKDRDLLRETEADRMADLDEDALLQLHKRIRRARNKSVKNYRRGASSAVGDQGSRGAAHPGNSLARDRTEVFEDALARVSARVEVLARQAAEELRAERLAAAAAGRGTGPAQGGAVDTAPAGVDRTHEKTTGGTKRDASSQAQGARRQAERDSR